MRVWTKLVGQWTRALKGDRGIIQSELASTGGIDVDNECRPSDKVGSSQRSAVVDEAEVGWCASLGGHVCNPRQASGIKVERKRVDRPSVCLVRRINYRREFRKIGEPRWARSRLELGDEGEGWWILRELKSGD